MNQLKEELEISKDESERSRQNLDEEKRRREVVRNPFIILRCLFLSLLISVSTLC